MRGTPRHWQEHVVDIMHTIGLAKMLSRGKSRSGQRGTGCFRAGSSPEMHSEITEAAARLEPAEVAADQRDTPRATQLFHIWVLLVT